VTGDFLERSTDDASTDRDRPGKPIRAYDAAVRGVVSAVRGACRLTRIGGGTSLPGLLVQRLDPGFVARRAMSIDRGTVVVSGTNGKTTTAAMISAVLAANGEEVVTNHSGANLFRGVAAVLARAPTSASAAVFEVDEGALERLVPMLRPKVLVLTNVFRDQLDRFGEPETVARLLREAAEGLPPGTAIVANADDPLLWHSLQHLRPIGFGVRGAGARSAARLEGEPERCPRCEGSLSYARRTIAHLGQARCGRCGWRSREPDHTAVVAGPAGLASMALSIQDRSLRLQLGGIHNAYNAAAAIAAATALDVPIDDSVRALEAFHASFGRTEELVFRDRPLWLLLAKNPAGTSATVGQVLAQDDARTVVIMVNDRSADGRDVSWIWDADFESLVRGGRRIVAGGTRAAEVAVRIKYAGGSVIGAEEDAARALSAAAEASDPRETLCVLATYTAMLEVRKAVLDSRVARVEEMAA